MSVLRRCLGKLHKPSFRTQLPTYTSPAKGSFVGKHDKYLVGESTASAL